jgi:hypothetical protein
MPGAAGDAEVQRDRSQTCCCMRPDFCIGAGLVRIRAGNQGYELLGHGFYWP